MSEIWDWASHYAVAFWDALSLGDWIWWLAASSTDRLLVRFAETVFKRYKNKVKYWWPSTKLITKLTIPDFAPFTNSGLKFTDGEDREPVMYQVKPIMSLWQVRKLSKLVMTSILSFKSVAWLLCVRFTQRAWIRGTSWRRRLPCNAVTGLVMYMRAVIIRATWRLTSSVVVLNSTSPRLIKKIWQQEQWTTLAFLTTWAMRKDAEHGAGFDCQMRRKEPIRNPYVDVSEWGGRLTRLAYAMWWTGLTSAMNCHCLLLKMVLVQVDEIVDGKIHDDYRIAYLRAHIEQNDRCRRNRWCWLTWLHTVGLYWFDFAELTEMKTLWYDLCR